MHDPTDRRADWQLPLREAKVVQKGFSPEEALLPQPRRVYDGYRLLQEYFAMPERFRFVELQGLQAGLQKSEGNEVDLYILLRESSKPDTSNRPVLRTRTRHETGTFVRAGRFLPPSQPVAEENEDTPPKP